MTSLRDWAESGWLGPQKTSREEVGGLLGIVGCDLQHYRTIQALGLLLGPDRKTDVEYLEVCRKKRNIIEYDAAGTVTDRDAKELVAFVVELRDRVLAWLEEHHSELIEP
jgi:hypothetical protein